MTKKREPKYDPVDAIFFVNVRNRVRAEFKRAYPPHVKYIQGLYEFVGGRNEQRD